MPEQVTLLDNLVPVDFLVGQNPPYALDKAALMQGLQEVVALINATAWTPEQRDTYRAIRKIVFFEGLIEVNGYQLDRPCCDEDDRIFYWEANEFMANTDRAVRAHTLFHDCFHVIQYWRRQTFAQSENERVAREVEAIDQQIEVAKRLGTYPASIAFLEAFKSDQSRLEARLAEGVRMHHDKDAVRSPVLLADAGAPGDHTQG